MSKHDSAFGYSYVDHTAKFASLLHLGKVEALRRVWVEDAGVLYGSHFIDPLETGALQVGHVMHLYNGFPSTRQGPLMGQDRNGDRRIIWE